MTDKVKAYVRRMEAEPELYKYVSDAAKEAGLTINDYLQRILLNEPEVFQQILDLADEEESLDNTDYDMYGDNRDYQDY